MSVYGVIASAHQGQCFANLARRFRISEDQAANAVYFVLPALLDGLDRQLESHADLFAFLSHLAEPTLEELFSDPATLNNLAARTLGAELIRELLPSGQAQTDLLAAASRNCHLDQPLVARILPHVALLMLTAIRRQAEQPMRDALFKLTQNKAASYHSPEPFSRLADVLSGNAHKNEPAVLRLIGRLFAGAGQSAVAGSSR